MLVYYFGLPFARQPPPPSNLPSPYKFQEIDKNSRKGLHYEVIRKIGEGSFGVIYLGKSDLTSEFVAIKFESRKSDAPQLKDEHRAYRLLNIAMQKNPNNPLMEGIPKVYYYGQETLFNYLILDFLGPSLEEVFERNSRSFSPKTIAHIAIEMIKRIELIHSCNLVYRDIKPDNFLLPSKHNGTTASNTMDVPPIIYIVDFGMAKYYIDPRTSQHIPYKEKKSLSGTARYMSIHTHLGHEQSRRDDMESLGNVFIYLLRGHLPWQGLKAKDNREKYERIGQVKQATSPESLCEGKPPQFAQYLRYARELDFYEKPDYSMCKSLFEEVLSLPDEDQISNSNGGGGIDWSILNTSYNRKVSTSSLSSNSKKKIYPPRRPLDNNNNNNNNGVISGGGDHNFGSYNNNNENNNNENNNNENDNNESLPNRCSWRRLFCLE